MPKRVHSIHSLPEDANWAPGEEPVKSSTKTRMLERLLSVQRPVVLAHLRSIRLRHPDASAEQLVRILEKRYLMAVTSGGAAVGSTAVIPGVGTGIMLALSGVETAGFLEATALFAQSVAEVHGMHVNDPERANVLVLALMLGNEGTDLVRQFTSEAKGDGKRSAFWGDLLTKSLPQRAVGPLVDTLKQKFLAHFAARGGASVFSKALPFGIGAVVGGGGNHLLGRKVVKNTRSAFGPAPLAVPAEIEPRVGAQRVEHRVGAAGSRAAKAVGRAGRTATTSLGRGANATLRAVTRRNHHHRSEDAATEEASSSDAPADAS